MRISGDSNLAIRLIRRDLFGPGVFLPALPSRRAIHLRLAQRIHLGPTRCTHSPSRRLERCNRVERPQPWAMPCDPLKPELRPLRPVPPGEAAPFLLPIPIKSCVTPPNYRPDSADHRGSLIDVLV